MRGKWVMEVLLGSPPPPPPANVPPFDDTKAAAGGKLLSVRERMEEHRRNPACTSCHRVIDPIGLALDNFDVTGKWRIKDNGVPVDATRPAVRRHQDRRPGGAARRAPQSQAGGASELHRTADDLRARAAASSRTTCRPCARSSATPRRNDYKMSSFITGIVNSGAFRMSKATRERDDGRKVRCRAGLQPGRQRETDDGDQQASGICRDEPCCRGWARPWRCRSSKRCSRTPAQAEGGARRQAALRRHRDGARLGRQHGVRPAEESVVAGARSGRPSICRRACSARSSRTASSSPSSVTPTCETPRRSPAPEIGGDHFRSAAVFLTQAHPHQTQGSDLKAGTSLDQLVAQKFGQDTPIPSMQLCIENVDQAGGCFYGYSCAYTDSISWKSPEEPLPMVRDPRLVFDQLFGVGATAEARAARRKKDRSILDWVTESANRLNKRLGAADRARLDDYLEDVREVERRIQKVEAFNSSGEQREQPNAPIGVPDSLRRARQADVRSAGDRVRLGHHARVRVQDEPRRVEPRLPRRRRHRPASTSRRTIRIATSASWSSRRSTSTTSACCRTSSIG